MKILTQKFAPFGLMEVEGKKKWSCVVACWVLNENSIERDLIHVGAKPSFPLRMSETVWIKSSIQKVSLCPL